MVDVDVELPDQGDNIIRTRALAEEYNPNGLGFELFTSMKRHRDSVAQIDAATGKTDTYSSLLQRSVRMAMGLKARGVTTEDIITPCTLNHLDSIVPFLAGLFIGTKVASLDPTMSLDDIKHLLKQVKPKMIFVQPESEELLEKAITDINLTSEIVVFGETTRNVSYNEYLKPSPEEADFAPSHAKNVKDTALIYFSSGTTGLPKGICISHYSLMIQLNGFRQLMNVNGILMNFSSLYWVSCLFMLLQCIITGSTRVVCGTFDPIVFYKCIEQYRVTSISLSATEAIVILKVGRPEGIDLPSLKLIGIIGGAISGKNMTALRNLFPETFVFLSYGQTEVGGITGFSVNSIPTLLKKPASVGQAKKGYWYKIVDPETEKILGANEKGELRLKTKVQMNGYYNMDSSDMWDSDGYLKTGDICYYDDDHYFFVVDRLKEMLKYRSWHVPPAILEGILMDHPAVNVAVVIGLPHEEDGEHPMALVELTKDAGNVTEEELVKFVDERVDDRKRLRGGVRFITDVPYTPSAKVNRYLLKRRVLGN